jgi:hypothetical protein
MSKLEKAKLEHKKFLKKMGCLPEQIKKRKKNNKSFKLGFEGCAANYFETNRELSQVMTGDTTTATKRDIITNIYKEKPEVQKQIREKASRTGILVNKGGYGYITPGMDPTTLGRK